MSDVVKVQHYVPQFYLNYFANGNNRIFVYDKFDLKTFASNSRGISSEGYFYDLIDGEVQTIEKVLNAKFESAFSNFLPEFLQKLDNHKHFRLKRYEKEEIASFLSYQYIRTKRFREESVRLFSSPDIYFSEPHFDPLLGHIFLLTDHRIQEGICRNLINNYYWIFGRNSTAELFYTSDHPFVQRDSLHELHERYKKEFADFTLLSDELSFPLTPRLNVTFYKKNKVFKSVRHSDGKIIDVTSDNVKWYNNMQVMKSYRQIYSQEDDFSLIEGLEEIRRKNLIASGLPEDILKVPKNKK
jgi:hypothetical protein